jgi:uncharacterized membrane protein YgcG
MRGPTAGRTRGTREARRAWCVRIRLPSRRATRRPRTCTPCRTRTRARSSSSRTYYTQCLDSASTAQTCAPWTNMPDGAHQACLACLVTPATASAYGPVVQTTLGNIIVSEPNLAGCVEIADPAGLSCATKLQDRTDCDEQACTVQCPVTDDPSFQLWQTCVANADNAAGSCQTYYQATSCVSSEMPDGGVAEACFTTAANPGFADDYAAIAPVFCLDITAGADGGGGDGGGGSDASGSGDGGGGGSDASGGVDGGAVDGAFTPVDGGPVTTAAVARARPSRAPGAAAAPRRPPRGPLRSSRSRASSSWPARADAGADERLPAGLRLSAARPTWRTGCGPTALPCPRPSRR